MSPANTLLQPTTLNRFSPADTIATEHLARLRPPAIFRQRDEARRSPSALRGNRHGRLETRAAAHPGLPSFVQYIEQKGAKSVQYTEQIWHCVCLSSRKRKTRHRGGRQTHQVKTGWKLLSCCKTPHSTPLRSQTLRGRSVICPGFPVAKQCPPPRRSRGDPRFTLPRNGNPDK